MQDQFDDTQEFSLRDVLDVLRRRKWVVAQAFVFVTVIGVVMAMMSPPVYGASAKMLVDTPDNSIRQYTIDPNNPLTPIHDLVVRHTVDTQLAILRSADFRRRVEKQLPGGQAGAVGLQYNVEERTSIVTITGEGSVPANVAATANAAVQAYIQLTQEVNKEALKRANAQLEKDEKQSRARLDRAQKALMAFKQKTRLPDAPEAQTIEIQVAEQAAQKARDTRGELISINSKLKTLRRRAAVLPETIKEVKVATNPEVEAIRQRIAQLRTERALLLGTFQPGSARIVDKDEEIKSLEEAREGMQPTITDELVKPNPEREVIQRQIDELEMNREQLTILLGELTTEASKRQKQASQVAPWGVELSALQRELDIAQREHETVAAQLRDVSLRNQLTGPGGGAREMERAMTPQTPIRPQKAQQVGLAMLMGLMLGIGFAFLQEFLDDRVNTSDDVARVTALATLGTVPTIPEDNPRLLIGQDAFSPITESYRSLRTSVQFSSIDRKIHLLGVTSAHPGEGKSVTSANLAIAMALQGKRVLIVDADLRRPTVHRLFDVEAEPGLTSVLAGELALEEALHTTSIEGLRVLTAGPLPPNPPELLNSQVMLDLMDTMKDIADVVIFDTPPTIPVTDAQVLGSHLDGMILVVEAGQARKAAVKHAREMLERTRVRLLGVVLNKIDQNSKGYYHQYYYKGRGYSRDEGYGPRGRRLGTGPEGEAPRAPEREPAGSLPERLRDWE
jgi:succinoglycan biosynthesis transport protein ExoP